MVCLRDIFMVDLCAHTLYGVSDSIRASARVQVELIKLNGKDICHFAINNELGVELGDINERR